MANFSKRSNDNLKTCNPNLQLILNESIKLVDFSIICGVRLISEQTRLYAKGREFNEEINKWIVIDKAKIVTYTKYPDSKHNRSIIFKDLKLSDAFDVTPYPRPENFWKKVGDLDDAVTGLYINLNRIFQIIAKRHKIKLKWGGDWQMKGRTNFIERKAQGEFVDLPHWQESI